MQFAQIAAVAGLAASAAAQGVTARIAPQAPAPAGCQPNYDGRFQISVVNASTPAKAKRAGGDLILQLHDGVLTEQTKGAVGYIADNYQFQFDKPPQTGAIYTAGFSACSNGTLALGGSSIFYQCLSGSFYNLYDRHWAPQCEPIFLAILPYGAAQSTQVVTSTGSVNAAATGAKPTVTSNSLISQISDNQPQVPTMAIPQTSSIAVVTMISDGQPQGPKSVATAMPIPVSQIGDGQPQAPTGVVSQIGDGQPQAPKATIATATVPKNATVATPAARYTGAASSVQAGSAFAVVFGAVAAAFL